jgi:hypothetical protein
MFVRFVACCYRPATGGGTVATIKAFLRELEGDPQLLALFRQDPQAACRQEGLTEEQCAIVTGGDLNAIRDAIKEESPGRGTEGLHLRVVM